MRFTSFLTNSQVLQNTIRLAGSKIRNEEDCSADTNRASVICNWAEFLELGSINCGRVVFL